MQGTEKAIPGQKEKSLLLLLGMILIAKDTDD
jgi:hypothetical protein